MKNSLIKSLILGMVLGGMAYAKEIVIKFSHVTTENTPKGQMAIRFKELVEKRLPGKVKVEVYPNSQLFGDNKVLEAMLLGDVQLASPSIAKFQKYTKKLLIYDLPFLFKDMDAVEHFQNSPDGQKLLMSVSKRGLLGLGYLHGGFKNISANTPIVKPQDVKGKKIRVVTSDVYQSSYEILGAVPLKKPFSEVFTLLQTKAIDSQQNTWTNIWSKKFFEVQKYITETNAFLNDYMVVTSKYFWDSLDKKIQPIIKKSLDEAIAYANEVFVQQTKRDRQAIIDSGRNKVISLTPKQREEWVKAMKPVYREFEKEIGVDLIKKVQSLNNK